MAGTPRALPAYCGEAALSPRAEHPDLLQARPAEACRLLAMKEAGRHAPRLVFGEQAWPLNIFSK